MIRVIHLEATTPPHDYEPDAAGYSIGHFEADGTLVVETAHFAPTRWGSEMGVDSSDQKRVTQRYQLADGGLGMSLTYTLEDPVNLREPVTIQGRYRKVADHEFPEEYCDAETSRKFLEFQ